MPACRVNDHEVCRSTGCQSVAHDGDGILCFRLPVNLDGGFLKQLGKLGVRTGTVHVGFDHRHAKAVLSAVPLGQFGRRCGFSLPVQSHQKKGGSSRLEIGGWAENSHEFRVEDVHGVGLHVEARTRFLLSHSGFKPVDDVLGLPDVEVGFLERSAKASRHFSQFFLVQLSFVLEQAKRAKDSSR